MAETKTAVANKPAWVDLSTSDAAGAREFYSRLFGWKIEVNSDPQYGGYGMAKVGGKDVAGIGPKQDPSGPNAWMVYIGTTDADDLSKKVQAAGGKVIAPAFDVGDQGKMAVYQDPSGAFVSAWQPAQMAPFTHGQANTFGWAELNARGVEQAIPFYKKVFGWTEKKSDTGQGGGPQYTEFQLGGDSIAGAWEMNPMAPAEMPSYWMVYFNVDDVDKAFQKAIDSGATEMMAPQDFPGGRFAIVSDPQGAAFGLLKTQPR
jgi:predicted enzyme related to lactoylglutathione lyase